MLLLLVAGTAQIAQRVGVVLLKACEPMLLGRWRRPSSLQAQLRTTWRRRPEGAHNGRLRARRVSRPKTSASSNPSIGHARMQATTAACRPDKRLNAASDNTTATATTTEQSCKMLFWGP